MTGRLVRPARSALYLLANVTGVLAFVGLLLQPEGASAGAPEAAVLVAAPVLLALLAGLAFAALAAETGADGLGSRAVAVLGVLVAMNSALRFVEVALPGPGGFTPIFVLVVLAGYAYGARFGFLTGALTLAVSAIVTGGVGPWLPYQMFAAGWVGLTSGWLPGHGRSTGSPAAAASRRKVVGLALFGALWSFAYGFLLTIWAWSFVDAGAVGAAPGSEPLARYLVYYVATSLVWDCFGAAGTFVLLVATGGPLLVALGRFQLRFGFRVQGPPPDVPAAEVPAAALAWDGNERGLPEWLRSENLPEAALAGPAIHARAWLAWALALAALASITRNPVLLGGAALAVAVVRAALPPAEDGPALPVGRLALLIVAGAALYNLLLAHAGATVLARLPAGWPLVGGPLTLEALAYGALTGLGLALLLAAFATLRRALSARELVRLVPRAFGSLALVVTVALTYLPATLAELAAVREAQAVRGGAPKGPAGWLRLAVPLVVGGLERSLHLAESLAARGLSSGGPDAHRATDTLVLLLGLAAALLGWLLPVVGALPPNAGLALFAAGTAVALLALLRRGRRLPHSDLRPAPWRWSDSFVALAAWLPVALAAGTPDGRAALAWLPYPALDLPPAPAGLVLSLAGLALPALVLGALGRRVRRAALAAP